MIKIQSKILEQLIRYKIRMPTSISSESFEKKNRMKDNKKN